MKEKVTLNAKEQQRLMVCNRVGSGEVSGKDAAQLMGLSLRHTRRLLRAYRKEGVQALVHGNRGREPANAIGSSLKEKVLELAQDRYAGVNQQHFTELLSEREGLVLSRSSVRNILLSNGIRSPRRRRPPQHRCRRERYAQDGMLLQIDASPHYWLGLRGPELNLVGAIDDATGKVPYAHFREQEDTVGYFRLIEKVVERYGIPLAIYRDRHSIFEVPKAEGETIDEQLAGKEHLTQFGRMLGELGITSIAAMSPQAKGRIERLWGTFQDRLVSELRLEGVSTLEEANLFLESFLARYNARFAVPPAQPGLAYRSTDGIDLEAIFCLKHERVVGADNVVRFNGTRLQIFPSHERASYARCHVEVHEPIGGGLRVYYQGRYLEASPAPKEATTMRRLAGADVRLRQTNRCKVKQAAKPSKAHPWRQWVYR